MSMSEAFASVFRVIAIGLVSLAEAIILLGWYLIPIATIVTVSIYVLLTLMDYGLPNNGLTLTVFGVILSITTVSLGVWYVTNYSPPYLYNIVYGEKDDTTELSQFAVNLNRV